MWSVILLNCPDRDIGNSLKINRHINQWSRANINTAKNWYIRNNSEIGCVDFSIWCIKREIIVKAHLNCKNCSCYRTINNKFLNCVIISTKINILFRIWVLWWVFWASTVNANHIFNTCTNIIKENQSYVIVIVQTWLVFSWYIKCRSNILHSVWSISRTPICFNKIRIREVNQEWSWTVNRHCWGT